MACHHQLRAVLGDRCTRLRNAGIIRDTTTRLSHLGLGNILVHAPGIGLSAFRIDRKPRLRDAGLSPPVLEGVRKTDERALLPDWTSTCN